MAPPPAKRQRHDFSDAITLSAGRGMQGKTFIVHNSFATESSKYIQAALKAGWKEGQEKHITLPDYEPATLEGYINWLYTKEVTLKNFEEKCGNHGPTGSQEAQNSDCSHKHFLNLAMMYTLGDYLNDLKFCNAVVDKMMLMRGCAPGPDGVRWVWTQMMQDCPVQKLVLERWIAILDHPATATYMRNNSSRLPKEFMIDLLVFTGTDHSSSIRKLSLARLTPEDKCKFHKHVDDSDKCV